MFVHFFPRFPDSPTSFSPRFVRPSSSVTTRFGRGLSEHCGDFIPLSPLVAALWTAV